jgi:superfamily II DNA or RNA helicase
MTNALHPKSAYWIRQGIFDGLESFETFEARVNKIAEEKDRGDIFEIFIEGYLATQAINQCVKHWVVGNIPLSLRQRYKLPKDATGIDGIYETHDGSHVAYQVKYRQKQQLTFAEVAPFLGITEQFSDRVIFTNAARLSHKALVRTRWVSADVFRDLSSDALSSIEAWIKVKSTPVIRAKPDPSYQVQALADIKETLAKHDKATVVTACGTGKTLVALWAAEQEVPKTVLVLVPSLTLLQQTLREWSEQTSWGGSFSYLCVCSDPTVGLRNDDLNIDKSEVGFRIDTDPTIVRQFLERQTADIKVVFSTYQSSPVVGEGARELPPFDVGIFDEAHKTIGLAGGAFGYALSDDNIRIRKRLFLTATPRHIDISRRDKEGEFRIYSMDDETVYGPRAHILSFGAAAQKGIICRYKVIISLIDKEMVDDFTRRRGITLVEHDEISARWMANLIAVQQAIKKVDAKKIITFHSRIRLADDFAANLPRGIAYHLRDYEVRHVNGEQSSGERGEIIRSFADAQKALLTNARCLTEGINIPAVDMVAFIDPRQSKVDITQAVGRAMRKPRGPTTKTFGYIVVPVFAGVGEKDSLDEAIKSEKFEAVVDVLNALQEHDEELVDIIREIRERKGAGDPFNPRRLNEKVEVIGPRIDLDRLTTSIDVEIADSIGVSWDEWFGRLQSYKNRVGDCRVPIRHLENGYKLGSWVANQRAGKDKLSKERRERLDDIGFEWDPLLADWEEGFRCLKLYKDRIGDCRVPLNHIENGFRLGRWARNGRDQRYSFSKERRRRLDDIGFVWGTYSDSWEKGFRHLIVYKSRVGDCRVPAKHLEQGFKLGSWVSVQRKEKTQLSEEQRKRLDELEFDWDIFSTNWEKALGYLQRYKERVGDCRVPQNHIEHGFKLGNWVGKQRKAENGLSEERRKRLDDMGFVWNAFSTNWEHEFSVLKLYKDRVGDCRVPLNHIENGVRLGRWVNIERKRKNRSFDERKKRLDDIGFDIGFVRDAYSDSWKKGFSHLEVYKDRVGDCRVPANHLENGYKLGSWVIGQRYEKNQLSEEQRKRLDELGFDWDIYLREWEKAIGYLKTYKDRVGDCLVPYRHIENRFKLGSWVGKQRREKNRMSEERQKRLDDMGFVWNPRTGECT